MTINQTFKFSSSSKDANPLSIQNIRFGLKSGMDINQLADRITKCRQLGIPVFIELHTSTNVEVSDLARISITKDLLQTLRAECEVTVTLHTPPVVIKEIGALPFDRAQALATLEMAQKIGADKVILHRSYAYCKGKEKNLIPKEEASELFNAEIRILAQHCGQTHLEIENVGFFHRGNATNYFISSLDHFFPWERQCFQRFLDNEKLSSVEMMLDIAHATQSANMFNLLRNQHSVYRNDPRFRNITEEDLDQTANISPFDFMNEKCSYYHLSDALFLGDLARCSLDSKTLELGMISENLKIGSGNLDFVQFLRKLQTNLPITCIAEVNPAANESHHNNQSQLETIRHLLTIISCSTGY